MSRQIRITLLIVSLLTTINILPSYADSKNDAGDSKLTVARPKTGLVLAGGGALGFAHIGVLKVMEREHISVDVITGTSMGSIVGAAYASGRTLKEIEEIIKTTKWDELFKETPPRAKLPYQLKPGKDRDILGDIKIGFKDGKVAVPQGAIQGVSILPVLQRLYSKFPGEINFDDLPIPYRAVAADIETGREVIISSGHLGKAARASMSVPGVFTPVELNGRLLVDGGIANNLPMDVARDMGATRLIVVELPADLKKRAELRSPLDISGQVLSMLLAQNSRLQLETIRKEDVLVLPNLDGYTPTDFDKANELVAIGEAAAEKIVEQLRAFSVGPGTYAVFDKKRTGTVNPDVSIQFVKIENDSFTADEAIRRKLPKEGEKFDQLALEKGIRDLYDTGQFSDVNYSLVEDNGQQGVIVTVRQKPWLQRYFRFGFAVQDDLDGNNNYSLATAYRANRLTESGTALEVNAEIGLTPRLAGELIQPLETGSSWFVAPSLEASGSPINLSTDDSEIFAKYRRRIAGGALRLGRTLNEFGEASVGVERYAGDLKLDIGSPELNERSYQVGNLTSSLVIDTLDDIDFPEEGVRVETRYRGGREFLSSDAKFDQVTAYLTKPFTYGRNTLLFRSDSGTTFGDLPVEQSYTMGGFFDFSGVPLNSIVASDYGIFRLLGYRRITEESSSPLGGVDLYLGGSLEIGYFRNDFNFPDRGVVNGGSAFLGIDTPIMPLYFGVGLAEEANRSVYISFGRQFRSRR